MSLPDAVGYIGAVAGAFAGFSVPGIEVFEGGCGGGPIIPCQVDEGDVCRARWVNRQDHGYLTRVNLARANHPGAPYGCGDRGLECGVPQLHTEAYWEDEVSDVHRAYMEPVDAQPVAGQAREMVAKLRQGAQARAHARAVAGRRDVTSRTVVGQQAVVGNSYMQEQRQRRAWGNHQKHNENAGSVGIRYIPMSGAASDEHADPNHVGLTMEGDFDCLIMAPGHVRCDFYEE